MLYNLLLLSQFSCLVIFFIILLFFFLLLLFLDLTLLCFCHFFFQLFPFQFQLLLLFLQHPFLHDLLLLLIIKLSLLSLARFLVFLDLLHIHFVFLLSPTISFLIIIFFMEVLPLVISNFRLRGSRVG